MLSTDDEWSNFISNENIDNFTDSNIIKNKIYNNDNINYDYDYDYDNENNNNNHIKDISNCSELYISTKTKIAFLNVNIDIYNIFWKLKVIDYDDNVEGIIKKQIKISCLSHDELNNINDKLKNEKYIKCHIINSIDNPDGRVKFKNIQKISIGLSKKDILNARSKEKSAFYNCFVVTLRIFFNNKFREIHIKIFNTGKIEIPGVQNDDIFYKTIETIIKYLQNFNEIKIEYDKNNIENILINSNFNCGFCINRESLYNILRHKYKIHSCYDPCSYPGVQCIFHYNLKNKIQTGYIKDDDNKEDIIKISFMIFRTGSILIVGKCSDECIYKIYNFIKELLYKEYNKIVDDFCTKNKEINVKKNKRLCKKYIYLTQ